MRKAKIVDTIGPATESLEDLTKLVEAGMDVARLNRSHGTPEDHLKVYNNVRQASRATGRNVAALVDLQGPKIRCGWIKKNAQGEDKVQLQEGQEFVITTDDLEGDEHITSTTFKGLPGDCHAGDPILIDDGKVRLEVTKVEGSNVHTKVIVAGPVSSHKGINLPGVAVSLPALTEKDEADLRWAIRTGADIIAMSFVRFATDIDRAHEIMDEEGRRIPIVAKIEKPQAVENLEEIVKTFDGIMVARGDMAVEMPFEEVPLVTKRCIELARQYAKPVIVATEVLGSMVHSPIPSRAEASDCANAILDGADATMTSNETAVGDYPVETVRTMNRISSYATEHGYDRIPELKTLDMSSTGAVSSAAVDLSDKLNAKAIVAYTQTGHTVQRVSRERPAAPIYGLTSNEHTYHWLALSWGTEAFLLPGDYHDMSRKDLMIFTDKVLRDAGKAGDGDKIVILSSAQGVHQSGRTDSIYVHTVGACD
ncbi:pyruvate kinase [Bifidobacterium sp.]|jgi:pyruvate kinase|uniref:pyruvate kinase n=1 Tax=Bifidobacterium sp. TaxID=41200 RepID=UPI0025C59FF4|nr:pyruvate kinase [Bifidobacterium sp.]MCH4209182.1 pyruvate kinase [Bifidobacterium sp.]MCI1224628.1 pyruvate kinase [Bifidobacterium sp.]